MSNHWHFVFWVEVEWDVSAFLHRLTTTHAKGWRRETNTIGNGHVYGDRFKAIEVLDERYYYNLLRYVEQNPVRAGLVVSAKDWRWSSLAERNGNGRSILDPDPLGLPFAWNDLVEAPLAQSIADKIHNSLKRY